MSILASISSVSRATRKARAKRWATDMCRGKTGGAYGMNLFSSVGLYDNTTLSGVEIDAFHNARDPGETTYAINSALWCAELLPQLTCCVIHRDAGADGGAAGTGWVARYGRIAITKRHVLSCAHAHSWAAGDWPIQPNATTPTRLRFLDNTGATIDRVQISQADAVGFDLNVAVLDQDLPDTVFIPKVAPSTRLYELSGYQTMSLSQEFQQASAPDAKNWGRYANYNHQANNVNWYGVEYWARTPGLGGAGIAISHIISGSDSSISINVIGSSITITHGSAATIDGVVSAVTAHSAANTLVQATRYQNLGGSTAITRASSGVTGANLATPSSDYSLLNRQMFHCYVDGFRYGVWAGDSGTPIITLVNGEIIVSGIISGYQSDYCSPANTTWPNLLNGIIASADANAIASGRMSVPTGYTVTPYAGTIL